MFSLVSCQRFFYMWTGGVRGLDPASIMLITLTENVLCALPSSFILVSQALNSVPLLT
jgi:hypothetical protein